MKLQITCNLRLAAGLLNSSLLPMLVWRLPGLRVRSAFSVFVCVSSSFGMF